LAANAGQWGVNVPQLRKKGATGEAALQKYPGAALTLAGAAQQTLAK
jgi:hypothetical protein